MKSRSIIGNDACRAKLLAVLLVLPFISACGGGGAGGTASAPASGSLDSLFGTAGKVTTDLGSTGDRPSALVLQPNDKLVAAGFSGGDFALSRYFP